MCRALKAQLKKFSRFELRSGLARLKVQNLNWAGLGLETTIKISARLGLSSNSNLRLGIACQAVEKRAKLGQGEYTAKARKADRQYGNTPEGHIGRMEQKLLSFGRVRGLVVWPCGENI